MSKYKKLIIIPCVIIIVSLYLIGLNIVNRIDIVFDMWTDTSVQTVKTEEEENLELSGIGDKININTATESELMLLDGIGEVFAKRIIEMRDKLGGFSDINQIREIEGIGQKTYDNIKDYITVD